MLYEVITEIITQHIEDAIDRMKTSAEAVDVVLVGGGSILVADKLSYNFV